MGPQNVSKPKAARLKPMKATGRRGGPDVVIPDKLYFRIGEVAQLAHLPAYVLRFWETEFAQLKPVKSSTGQRMYRRRDVENVLRIKHLLYDQGFTIAGARQHLKEEARPARSQSPLPFPAAGSSDGLKRVRQGLQEILGILSKKRPR
jgi:DNA-binding transcriptional MerR regulator